MHPCLQLVWSSFKISDAQTKQLALVPLRDAIPSSSYQVACIDESGNARIIICSWEMWGGFWEQFQGVSRGVTVMLQLAVINAVEYPTSNWLLWKHTHTIFSLKGGATQIISRCVTQCHCYVTTSILLSQSPMLVTKCVNIQICMYENEPTILYDSDVPPHKLYCVLLLELSRWDAYRYKSMFLKMQPTGYPAATRPSKTTLGGVSHKILSHSSKLIQINLLKMHPPWGPVSERPLNTISRCATPSNSCQKVSHLRRLRYVLHGITIALRELHSYTL